MKKLLEVRNLEFSFQTYLGEVQAVRNISFSLFEGESVALVGESGCGKSATAQAIFGLIPSPPGKIHQGEILFDDQNLLKLSKKEMTHLRGKKMGMIFQDPMTSLNPTKRVGKQIIEGLIMHFGEKKQQAQKKAIEMLSLVGIGEPEKRYYNYPHQLSGGMRQRVMIAIALIHSPKLLIADEPTTALDVTIQTQILDLMKSIQRQTQTTILLITHDLGIVAGMADRVIVMYGGKILEIGTSLDIFKNPLHPYTQGLLRSVPRLDMAKSEALIPIVGVPPNLLSPPEGCPFAERCPFAVAQCTKSFPSATHQSNQRLVYCHLQTEKSIKQRVTTKISVSEKSLQSGGI